MILFRSSVMSSSDSPSELLDIGPPDPELADEVLEELEELVELPDELPGDDELDEVPASGAASPSLWASLSDPTRPLVWLTTCFARTPASVTLFRFSADSF